MCIISQAVFRHYKLSLLTNNMKEKTVSSLWEMITECNSLIIGTNNKIHIIILILIISLSLTRAVRHNFIFVRSTTLFKFQNQLIKMIFDYSPLTIYWRPCVIHCPSFNVHQFKILSPNFISIVRNSQCRFKKLIFNQYSQF